MSFHTVSPVEQHSFLSSCWGVWVLKHAGKRNLSLLRSGQKQRIVLAKTIVWRHRLARDFPVRFNDASIVFKTNQHWGSGDLNTHNRTHTHTMYHVHTQIYIDTHTRANTNTHNSIHVIHKHTHIQTHTQSNIKAFELLPICLWHLPAKSPNYRNFQATPKAEKASRPQCQSQTDNGLDFNLAHGCCPFHLHRHGYREFLGHTRLVSVLETENLKPNKSRVCIVHYYGTVWHVSPKCCQFE